MPVLRNGELYLYGFVGDSYWDEGFTASEVVDALIDIGRETDVRVHINSGGGYTDDGIAIHNSLIAHKGKVTVLVDAMAASSASLIVMAGDERIMLSGSMMMIHDPSGMTWGNASDHEKQSDRLNKLAENMAGIYSDAIGEPSANLRKDMKEELWLTPKEAVERGFATSAGNDEAKFTSAFDYRLYAKTPKRLVALSDKNSWDFKKAKAEKIRAAALVENGHKGDCKMPETQSAETISAKETTSAVNADEKISNEDVAEKAVAADRQRRSDIMALDEAKGREDLAEKLFATNMPIDQVRAALDSAPMGEDSASSPADKYEASRIEASALAVPSSKNSASAKLDSKAIYAMRKNKTN